MCTVCAVCTVCTVCAVCIVLCGMYVLYVVCVLYVKYIYIPTVCVIYGIVYFLCILVCGVNKLCFCTQPKWSQFTTEASVLRGSFGIVLRFATTGGERGFDGKGSSVPSDRP